MSDLKHLTALEVVHQLQDDGIMTEKKAVSLIEHYANIDKILAFEKGAKWALSKLSNNGYNGWALCCHALFNKD
jgi:hypothetical protein